ncbi:MAG: hypothetical protein ACR2IV_05935 [Bryobacteraceae bacterium]
MSTSEVKTIYMKVRRFATQLPYLIIAIALMNVGPSRALAQDDHSHTMTQQNQQLTPEQQSKQNALVKIVRQWTERFQEGGRTRGVSP